MSSHLASRSSRLADVVICGAGIAGVAAAYHLAARRRAGRVIIVDEREPLTLTSDKGTQGYRNWWPGPDDTMLRVVSRSIDLLEETARESGNVFRMNRRGYLFATANEATLAELERTAARVSEFGMGDVRRHTRAGTYVAPPAEGFEKQPTGADVLVGDAIRSAHPYLSPQTVGAVHVRRAGTINAVALGSWFLTRAIAAGAEFVRGRVDDVDTSGGRVRALVLESGERIETDKLVVAAGPALPEIADMLDVDLPVRHELHAKMVFHDSRRIVPREAPFVIWDDPVTIHGREYPAGVHVRPVDLTHGDELYLIWTYETAERPFVWPPTFDPSSGDIVLRGSAAAIPGMQAYVESGATGIVDGGYYCKTPENRPLAGPLPIEGAFVLGALSGFGLMSAHGFAELVAQHVMEEKLPDYARWFLPSRYDDPAYRRLMEEWGPLVGQL